MAWLLSPQANIIIVSILATKLLGGSLILPHIGEHLNNTKLATASAFLVYLIFSFQPFVMKNRAVSIFTIKDAMIQGQPVAREMDMQPP